MTIFALKKTQPNDDNKTNDLNDISIASQIH